MSDSQWFEDRIGDDEEEESGAPEFEYGSELIDTPEPAESGAPVGDAAVAEPADPAHPAERPSIEQKVRDRLQQKLPRESRKIEVRMERGVICLSGLVESDAVRRRIADCVSSCGGVRVIRNRIRLMH
jgi:hypothetical protein